MDTTTRTDRDRGKRGPGRASTIQWIANGITRRHGGLPAALARHDARSHIGLIPRCCTPLADTMCDCGGLLAQVAGVWQHTDLCLACNDRPGPCDRPHRGCNRPAFRQCQQRRCSAPVSLDVGADPKVCDSCSRGGR